MTEEKDQEYLDQDTLNQRIDQAIALVGKQNQLLEHLYRKLLSKTNEEVGHKGAGIEPSRSTCSEGEASGTK